MFKVGFVDIKFSASLQCCRKFLEYNCKIKTNKLYFDFHNKNCQKWSENRFFFLVQNKAENTESNFTINILYCLIIKIESVSLALLVMKEVIYK